MPAAESVLTPTPPELSLLTEAIPQLVWVTDTTGRPLHFNQRWVAYTGSSLRSPLAWEDIVHADDRLRTIDTWHRSLATGEPYTCECRMRRVDGAYRWHLSSAVLLTDVRCRPRAWIGTCTDIQEQKAAAENQARELKQACAMAERSAQAKTAFLANMSYEMRTPLNGIIGITDVLIETPLDDQQLHFAKTIRHSGHGLLNLMTDVLDLSKMDAGKLVLAQAPIDLQALVQEQADALQLRATDKHLTLTTHVDPNVPARLVGDPIRLAQVLRSLITHAIKATNTGSVAVGVVLHKAQEHVATVRFSVEHTGIGFASELADRWFEPFAEDDNSGWHVANGTNLSLTVAKRLVDLMGGRMHCTSEGGCGTTFSFVLPFPQ